MKIRKGIGDKTLEIWLNEFLKLKQIDQEKILLENPEFFELFDDIPEQVQLAAVQQNGTSIKYIENPSEQVQLAAVQQDGYSIQYIKNPSEQVQLAAVQQNGYSIKYIKNPSEQVQLAAVQQDENAAKVIQNPTKNVKELYPELFMEIHKKDGEKVRLITNSIKTIINKKTREKIPFSP